MHNSKSTKDVFLANLERSLGRTQRRKGRSDNSEVEEILQNHHEEATEMGPILGFLSYIYKIPLPLQYEQHSK